MYKLSKDYETLHDLLLQGQEPVCFVENRRDFAPKVVRDVCQAKRHGAFRINVSARGITYAAVYPFELENGSLGERELFISSCQECGLEWLLPSAVDAVQLEVERLDERDGRASIELCFDDGLNPFARETLKILDFGVSDNIYVVESQTVVALRAEVERLREHIRMGSMIREG
jgi:hypothetical protein